MAVPGTTLAHEAEEVGVGVQRYVNEQVCGRGVERHASRAVAKSRLTVAGQAGVGVDLRAYAQGFSVGRERIARSGSGRPSELAVEQQGRTGEQPQDSGGHHTLHHGG